MPGLPLAVACRAGLIWQGSGGTDAWAAVVSKRSRLEASVCFDSLTEGRRMKQKLKGRLAQTRGLVKKDQKSA